RLAAFGSAHAITRRREAQADQFQQVGVVVDQQDVTGIHGASLRLTSATAATTAATAAAAAATSAAGAAAAATAHAVAQQAALHCAQRFELLDRRVGL